MNDARDKGVKGVAEQSSVSLGTYFNSQGNSSGRRSDVVAKKISETSTVCGSVLSIQSFAATIELEADAKFAEFMADAESVCQVDDDDSECSDLDHQIDYDDMTCDFFSFLDEKENDFSVEHAASTNTPQEHSEGETSARKKYWKTDWKKASSSQHSTENIPLGERGNSYNSLIVGTTLCATDNRNSHFDITRSNSNGLKKVFSENQSSPSSTSKGVLTPRNGNNILSPRSRRSNGKSFSSFPSSPKAALPPLDEKDSSTLLKLPQQSHDKEAFEFFCDEDISESSPGVSSPNGKSFSSFPSSPKAALPPLDEKDSSTLLKLPQQSHDKEDFEFFCDEDISESSPGVSSPKKKRLTDNQIHLEETENNTSVKKQKTASSKAIEPYTGHPVVHDEHDETDTVTRAYRFWRSKGLMKDADAHGKVTQKRGVSTFTSLKSRPNLSLPYEENTKSSLKSEDEEKDARKTENLEHIRATKPLKSKSAPGRPVVYDKNDVNDPCTKAYRAWSAKGLMKSHNVSAEGMKPCSLPKIHSRRKYRRDSSFSNVLESWEGRGDAFECNGGGVLSPLKDRGRNHLLKKWTSKLKEGETKSTPSCLCSTSMLSGNDDLVEFFLPDLGMATCTCGRNPTAFDKSDPTSLTNILRPWQVDFLKSFGIRRGDMLVKAHHRSAGLLAKAMRKWRKKHNMIEVKTISCGMALHIWSRTCKVYVRTIRKQLRKEMELQPPGVMDILSTFLEKVPVPEERRLSKRFSTSRLSIDSCVEI